MDGLLGTTILNYQLVEKLGEGGFGAVYRGVHETLRREVAIKVLRRDRAGDPELVERFLREARIVCEIDHPSIVQVENAGRLDSGEPFYIMELVAGVSLADLIDHRGALSPHFAKQIFAPLAEALAAAHARGVIHRDFKPHNVMVVERAGQVVAARLLDFGIAKLLAAGDASSTGNVLGSPHYMAPEQAVDSKRTTPAADVYAFAAALFHALTGRTVFRGAQVTAVLVDLVRRPAPRLREALGNVPAILDDTMARCLAKDPASRPASIADAWQALRAGLDQATDLGILLAPAAASGPVAPTALAETPVASMTPIPSGPPRRRWLAIAGPILALASIGALAWALGSRRAVDAPPRVVPIDAGPAAEAGPPRP